MGARIARDEERGENTKFSLRIYLRRNTPAKPWQSVDDVSRATEMRKRFRALSYYRLYPNERINDA